MYYNNHPQIYNDIGYWNKCRLIEVCSTGASTNIDNKLKVQAVSHKAILSDWDKNINSRMW